MEALDKQQAEQFEKSCRAAIALKQILHSRECHGRCREAICAYTSGVLIHSKVCHAGAHCSVTGCADARRLMSHYYKCPSRLERSINFGNSKCCGSKSHDKGDISNSACPDVVYPAPVATAQKLSTYCLLCALATSKVVSLQPSSRPALISLPTSLLYGGQSAAAIGVANKKKSRVEEEGSGPNNNKKRIIQDLSESPSSSLVMSPPPFANAPQPKAAKSNFCSSPTLASTSAYLVLNMPRGAGDPLLAGAAPASIHDLISSPVSTAQLMEEEENEKGDSLYMDSTQQLWPRSPLFGSAQLATPYIIDANNSDSPSKGAAGGLAHNFSNLASSDATASVGAICASTATVYQSTDCECCPVIVREAALVNYSVSWVRARA